MQTLKGLIGRQMALEQVARRLGLAKIDVPFRVGCSDSLSTELAQERNTLMSDVKFIGLDVHKN